MCACGKTLKTSGNREKYVWYGVCVVWCCEVRKCEKNARNNDKIVKTRTPFLGTKRWTPTKSENGHFPLRLVFTLPLGFADDFGPRSSPKRPKTPFLTRGPNPKVLIMR